MDILVSPCRFGTRMTDSLPDYPIRDVTDWQAVNDEPMGTKPKYWLRAPADERWLFKKKHRPHSDDDWSEKIAAELAPKQACPPQKPAKSPENTNRVRHAIC